MFVKDKKIGFIGLGTMGLPMAWNIHKAGFNLSVYNRTAVKTEPLKQEGAAVYTTPRTLAENTDVIIIMVTGSDELDQVMAYDNGVAAGLSSGKAVINMTTNSYEATKFAEMLTEKHNGQFLDAPVSGSKKPAEDGTLMILAGGKRILLDKMTPLLQAVGKTIVHCGPVGMGTRMKLMINMFLGGVLTSFCEALVFGKTRGLKLETMLEVINSGPMGNLLTKTKGQAIADENYAKNFSIALLFKDINLALEAAGFSGFPAHVTSAVRESLSGAMGMKLGNEDIAAIVKYFEKLADIKLVEKDQE